MRYLTIIFGAVLVLFSLHQAQAKIIRVPDDSSTIQGGIDGAVNGDTVLVAPGTYYEHINFNGKAILVTSESGPQNTTISKLVDETPIVTFNSGEDTTSILDGFTVSDATGDNAVLCDHSSPKIVNNKLRYNQVFAGISCKGTHAVIVGNEVTISGVHGIFSTDYDSVYIAYNLVTKNDFFGIDAYDNSYAVIVNNTVGGNYYDCIFCRASSPTIKNNILTDSQHGWGIGCEAGATPDISYNDVWNNSGGDYHDCGPGIGDISADPLFCEPENDNYYLHLSSPCLGAGEGGVDMGAFGVGCGLLAVIPGPDQAGPANSQVSVFFYLQSFQDSTDTFDLDVSDELGWNIGPTHYELVLDPGQVDTVDFTVSIPDVPLGTTDEVTLLAVSKTNPIARDSASLTVTCFCPGAIAGFVKDTLDQPIHPAEVEICELSETTQTDLSGYYEFADLLPAVYSLSVRASGYQTVETTNVAVVCEETTWVNFTLRGEYFSVSEYEVHDDDSWGLATGDFNQDNNVDIIAVSSWWVTSLLWGDGNGHFSLDDPIDIWGLACVNGYFNSDDFLDLAIGSTTQLAILLNDGSGDFQIRYFDLHGQSPPSIAKGYLDSDANLDIVTATCCPAPFHASLFKGVGDGDFIFVKHLEGYKVNAVDIGDFNKDGNADLVVGTMSTVTVLLGDGNWGFTESSATYLGGVYGLSTTDFNHDGNLDVISVIPWAEPSTNHIAILLGDGEGGFSSDTIINVHSGPQVFAVTVGDFNGDNNVDFATGHDLVVSVYFGDGTGNFSDNVFTDIGRIPLSIATGDFNKDGNLDIVTGSWREYISVLINNNPPTYNRGDVNGDGVIKASDVVFLIDYLFKSGPPPDPLELGDVNCDELIKCSDVVYLIDYLFKGGPPPCS